MVGWEYAFPQKCSSQKVTLSLKDHILDQDREYGYDIINPLTTNDDYSRHQNSAACYQLAQSVLKIGSALAERVGQGEVGGCTALLTVHGGCCSWL